MSLLILNTYSNHREGKQKSGCHRLGIKGSGSQCLLGTEFQLRKMNRALEMGGGSGCNTKWMYLMPQNCTIKTGKDGKLYVMCILP